MALKKISVLVSGGIESSVLISYFLQKKYHVFPIYLAKGHQWEKAELFWLRKYLKAVPHKHLKPLTALTLPAQDLYPSHWSFTGQQVPDETSQDEAVYLPGRNLLLVTKAAAYGSLHGISEIALGPLQSNPFPDASRTFFRLLEKTCARAFNISFKIHTPFLKCSKKQVLRQWKHLPLHLTFSCIHPKAFTHCGRCNKCAERKQAFLQAGLMDRTRYKY